jgi:hypothetical protein
MMLTVGNWRFLEGFLDPVDFFVYPLTSTGKPSSCRPIQPGNKEGCRHGLDLWGAD